MKKIINSKNLPYIAIAGSIVGLLLRLWTIGKGPDSQGLYESNLPAWLVLWLFTGGLTAAVIVAVKSLKQPGSYGENYPRSIIGMIGYVAAGIACFVCGYQQMTGVEIGLMDRLTAIGMLLSGGLLIILSVLRLQGKKPSFLLHGLLCLFFALRLFNRCQLWSNEPQTGVIVLPFLASMSMMLAFYHRACFDVDLGNRRQMLFWSALGTYFCILAVMSFQEIWFYGGCALWLMTNLCSLRPDRKEKQTDPQPVQESRPEEMSLEELETWLEDVDQK